MRYYHLKGSYYDFGVTYGLMLKEKGYITPKVSLKRLKLGLACRTKLETVFPEVLEEVKAITDTANLDYDWFSAFLFTISGEHGCTSVAITDDQTTYLGRNYDMYYSFKDFLECYFSEPKQGYKSIGQSDIFVGREDGLNEKGLAVAISGLPDYFVPGVNFWISNRYILDKCKNVQEAIDYLIGVPHYCTMNYLLADASGKLAVVEASPIKTMVRDAEEGIIASTNHWNHPKMMDIKLYEPPDSRIRYNSVINALKNRQEPISSNLMKGILSSHKGLVCSHRNEVRLGTLWSMIANLNTKQIWRAEGHPCDTPYVEDKRLLT